MEFGEWSWVLTGATETGSPRFATRLDAQAWLGENLSKLRTASHTSAQLTRQGTAVGQPVEL